VKVVGRGHNGWCHDNGVVSMAAAGVAWQHILSSAADLSLSIHFCAHGYSCVSVVGL